MVVTVAVLLGDDLALVDTVAGTREEVSVALVDAAVGDRVLVHAGEAIGTERGVGGAGTCGAP